MSYVDFGVLDVFRVPCSHMGNPILISTHVTYPNVNPNPNDAKNVEFVHSNNGNRFCGVTYLNNQPSNVFLRVFWGKIKTCGL